MGVTFTARELFDYELFKPFFRKFCVFCTIYLFLQMFFWNAGRIYLPNVFDFGIIKPMYEQYSAAKYIKYLTAIGFGRFSSFFAEPAYYGIMMIINLIILVFDIYYPQGLSNEAKIETLFIILGIWVSTSTAAIVFVVAIVLVYFVKTNMSDKFLLIIVAVSVGMFLISSAESNILGSFFISKLTQMGESGRVGASYAELDNLSTLQLIFGVGMNNEGVITESLYFNVFTGLIIEYGVLGFSIFLLYLYKIYETSDNIALHILIIIYMAAMFQGGYLFNLYGILFLSIAQNLGYKKLF